MISAGLDLISNWQLAATPDTSLSPSLLQVFLQTDQEKTKNKKKSPLNAEGDTRDHSSGLEEEEEEEEKKNPEKMLKPSVAVV